jgi:hypothetical protein
MVARIGGSQREIRTDSLDAEIDRQMGMQRLPRKSKQGKSVVQPEENVAPQVQKRNRPASRKTMP